MRLNRLSLIALWLLLSPLAFTQTNTPPATPDPLHTNLVQLWSFGIAMLTPLVILAVKWAVPKVPSALLPCLTPFVGIVLGNIFNEIGLAHLSWVDSAALGGLGVFIREVIDQTVFKRLNPNPPTN